MREEQQKRNDGVPVAEPTVGLSAISPAKKPEDAATIPHAEEPLRAVSEGTMRIEGYTLRTYVLNNGERVVDATDAENVMRAMGLIQ